LYRLEKEGWTSPDAMRAIKRLWKISPDALSYGGLKDRHAKTTQYITIFNGPQKNLKHERIFLEYLHPVPRAFSPQDIVGNRFTITIRDVNETEKNRLLERLPEVERCGFPNYFDNQRFGSVGYSKRFIAKEMILGHFEAALQLALVEPNESDRGPDKKEKALLKQYWGDWATLKSKLGKSHARSLVDYLVHHPTDFRGTVARLRPDLGGLYLAAYQSHVWNRFLAKWLTTHLAPNDLRMIELKLGEFPIPRQIPPELLSTWKTLSLPLPSARLKPQGHEPWLPILNAVLAEEGFPLEEMKIRGLQKPFFSRGERDAVINVSNLSVLVEPDEQHRGREKVLLKFELPRGCYATMIIKSLTE
jgi:tRNA pseudouridine13 synthase